MIHVCTLKYGSKYSSHNVNALYNSISKSCSVKFYCLTDDVSDLHKDIITLSVEDNLHEYTHWNKLRFYDPSFINASSDDIIIIMDIDQIFVGDPKIIIEHPVKPTEHLCAFRWWSAHSNMCPINGGLQKFVADGSQTHLWEKFKKDPKKWMIHYHTLSVMGKTKEAIRIGYGEQNYIYDNIKRTHTITYFPKESLGKLSKDPIMMTKLINRYKTGVGEDLLIDGKINPKIALVNFSGAENDVFYDYLPSTA
jgi:hypothetical protein